MAAALANKAGGALFDQQVKKLKAEDPVYETYVNEKGKTKKRKRAIPPGISAQDAAVLKAVRRRARLLDRGISFCGMKFGWNFIIGLVPIAGNVTSAVLNSVLVVRKARQADLPLWLLSRMLANNAFPIGFGFIPVVGDFIMAAYKPNSRNAALLEQFLCTRGQELLQKSQEEHNQIYQEDSEYQPIQVQHGR